MMVSRAVFGAVNDKLIFKSVPETIALMRGSMKDVVMTKMATSCWLREHTCLQTVTSTKLLV